MNALRFGWVVGVGVAFAGPAAAQLNFQFGGGPGKPGLGFNIGGPGQSSGFGFNIPGQGGKPGMQMSFNVPPPQPTWPGLGTQPWQGGNIITGTTPGGKQYKQFVPGGQSVNNNSFNVNPFGGSGNPFGWLNNTPTPAAPKKPAYGFAPGMNNATNNQLSSSTNGNWWRPTPNNSFPNIVPGGSNVANNAAASNLFATPSAYRPSYAATPAYQNIPLAPPGGSGAASNVFSSQQSKSAFGPSPSPLPSTVTRPQPQVSAGPSERWCKEKFLKLRNQTGQRVTFYVRYHRAANGLDQWVPGSTGFTSVTLNPGDEQYVTRNGTRVMADRVRVYAVAADGKKLEKYKTRDLVLGAPGEQDADGRLKYRATRMDTYNYTAFIAKSKKT